MCRLEEFERELVYALAPFTFVARAGVMETCREEFHYVCSIDELLGFRVGQYRKGYRNIYSAKGLEKHFGEFEDKLGIQNKTLFFQSPQKLSYVAIKVADWWQENALREAMFTAVLKDMAISDNYKDGWYSNYFDRQFYDTFMLGWTASQKQDRSEIGHIFTDWSDDTDFLVRPAAK